MMESLEEITSADQFDRDVLAADGPVAVVFRADWCSDCQVIYPHMEQWARQYAGRIKFVRVEDARRDLEGRYGVHMIPDVLVFLGGKLIHRWVNVIDPNAYRPTLDRLLGIVGA